MKKSVRNIVSFITCTCLVASLSAVSISADEEVAVENAVEVVEQPVVATQAATTQAAVKATQAATAAATAKATEAAKSTEAVAATEAAKEVAAATEAAKTNEAVIASEADSVNEVAVLGEAENVVSGTVAVDGSSAVVSDTESDEVVSEDGLPVVTSAVVSTDGTGSTKVTASSKKTVSQYNTVGEAKDSDNYVPDYEPVFVATTTKAVEEVEDVITKDVVLTIDTSNSTVGEPNELIKQTAIDLVNKLISEDPDVRISIVGFDGTAHTLEIGQTDEYNMAVTDENGDQVVDRYFNDVEFLTQEIEKMLDRENLGIGTDYYEALNEVKLVLDSGDGVEKSVVIMTDGQSSALFGSDNHDEKGKEISDGTVAGTDTDLTVALNSYLQGVIDFANEEIKPMATIYTIGYYQNLEEGEGQAEAEYLLKGLASELDKGQIQAPTYYEATEDNIDEVTDLIAKDITKNASATKKETKKTGSSSSSSNSSSSNSSSNASSSDSPKTSDAGVASVVVLGALAGAMLVITKKRD